MNDLMPLQRPFVLLDLIAEITLQWLHHQQYRTILENYDLIYVDDRVLLCGCNIENELIFHSTSVVHSHLRLKMRLPNFCGLYPGKCVTPRHVSSVGVPSSLKILSNWSYVSRIPGNVGIPVIISTNMQPTPHISNDVE